MNTEPLKLALLAAAVNRLHDNRQTLVEGVKAYPVLKQIAEDVFSLPWHIQFPTESEVEEIATRLLTYMETSSLSEEELVVITVLVLKISGTWQKYRKSFDRVVNFRSLYDKLCHYSNQIIEKAQYAIGVSIPCPIAVDRPTIREFKTYYPSASARGFDSRPRIKAPLLIRNRVNHPQCYPSCYFVTKEPLLPHEIRLLNKFFETRRITFDSQTNQLSFQTSSGDFTPFQRRLIKKRYGFRDHDLDLSRSVLLQDLFYNGLSLSTLILSSVVLFTLGIKLGELKAIFTKIVKWDIYNDFNVCIVED